MYKDFVRLVREIYQSNEYIPLHEPRFKGREKEYVQNTIDSSFVSSVGMFVDQFENNIAKYTGSSHGIATVNGTSALHAALLISGVSDGDEVITQSLTFVATCNAITYCGAKPIFVDVERKNPGMSPLSLSSFLEENTFISDDELCQNRQTGNIIRACLPMHTFGHPVQIDEIKSICDRHKVILIEDAAESLGSTYKDRHTGRTGMFSCLSFNGNKIITTGGGGMILTDDDLLAANAKHITTTARIKHSWNIEHDQLGFNYRLPNINAALGLAQLEMLPYFIENKREVARIYQDWCRNNSIDFLREPDGAHSNYWLNAILFDNLDERDKFLEYTNSNNVMTRPTWKPMHKLSMYKNCQKTTLDNTSMFENHLVNIPSSVTPRDCNVDS